MKYALTLLGAIAPVATGLAVVAAGPPPQVPPTPAKAQTAPAAAPSPTWDPQQKEVVQAIEAFTKAYSAADAGSLVAMFTDDGCVIDSDGAEVKGKAGLTEMYASGFAEAQGLKLESSVEDVKFLTPDVARAEGRSRLSAAEGDATEYTRFSALLVRKDGRWKAAEIREYPQPAADVAPYDRLRELEWMVGEWVDESANNKVTARVRWADNKSYLVREHAVELQGEKASSGTMFIGWDPQSGTIKSWLFDSEGGRGEGQWTRTGENEWVVKAVGVLRDGRPTSATQVYTVLNKDSVKTNSIDRIIGGEIAPDINDIVMVRKGPAPAPAGR